MTDQPEKKSWPNIRTRNPLYTPALIPGLYKGRGVIITKRMIENKISGFVINHTLVPRI